MLTCAKCGTEYTQPEHVANDPHPELCSTCWAEAVVGDIDDSLRETRDERAVRERSYDSPPEPPAVSQR